MTIIAYRNGVLACDSLWTYGRLKTLWKSKIVRLSSGALFGASGDADNRALLALVDECEDADDLPTMEDLAGLRGSSIGLLILPNGRGWMVASPGDEKGGSCGAWPAFTGRKGFAAIGCGEQLALGALEMGASAAAAVRVACRRNSQCGLPIHTLEL